MAGESPSVWNSTFILIASLAGALPVKSRCQADTEGARSGGYLA